MATTNPFTATAPLLQRVSRSSGIAARPARFVLVASDGIALLGSGAISVIFWYLAAGKLNPGFYLSLWPLLLAFIGAYAATGLYPTEVLSPVQELRRITKTTCLVFAVLGASMFLSREGESYSRAVFLLTWTQSLLYVPLLRALARAVFSRCRWWGQQTIVVGASGVGHSVVRALRSQPALGLKPMLVVGTRDESVTDVDGIPVVQDWEVVGNIAAKLGVESAIIAVSELSRAELGKLLGECRERFSRVIVVPQLTGPASLWVETADLGGILGLEISQRLLLPIPRLLKRSIDVAAVLTGGTLILPLLMLTAVLVKCTTRGPVFYGHRRLGRDGEAFTAWKFRTMVQDAERVLADELLMDPDRRREWDQDHKLRDDPRITWLGRLLRKTSLDELPQLWNVLCSEMSLVGPRPIVSDEMSRYGNDIGLYEKVLPGMTGLWQVSGRNDVDYEHRVQLDAYYVSNWSVWLDIYILARTVRTVLRGKGAY
jgi:Undecaprenyl-phosphate galactose phosphotransferase WbaP